MKEIIYKEIEKVIFKSTSNAYTMHYIAGVDEDNNIIKINSVAKIDGLERGCFGNLCYEAKKAVELSNATVEKVHNDGNKETVVICCIKDVVLKQIEINSETENATYFTYVFVRI